MIVNGAEEFVLSISQTGTEKDIKLFDYLSGYIHGIITLCIGWWCGYRLNQKRIAYYIDLSGRLRADIE